MTDTLASVYQDVIIENARHPRNFRRPAEPTHVLHAHNPLCGDQLTLFLTISEDTITDVAFEGSGCAISTASASLLTVAAKGLTRAQALDLFSDVHTMLTVEPVPTGAEPGAEPDVGQLAALAGVRAYPMRVKCASLAWQTLRGALIGDQREQRTE